MTSKQLSTKICLQTEPDDNKSSHCRKRGYFKFARWRSLKETIVVWSVIHSWSFILKRSWIDGIVQEPHGPVVKKTEMDHTLLQERNLRFSVGKTTFSVGNPGNSCARTFEKHVVTNMHFVRENSLFKCLKCQNTSSVRYLRHEKPR